MPSLLKILAALAVLGTIALAASPALAKPARCFTTDDGYYDCNFKALGKDGSFEVSAAGYPTYMLEIESPGFAFGFAQFEPGGRNVPLPGMYVRSRDDGACWNNPDTEAKLCAW